MKKLILATLLLSSVPAFTQAQTQQACPVISEDIHPDPSLHLNTEHLNQLRIQQFVHAHACEWIKTNNYPAINRYVLKPLYWDFTSEARNHPAFLHKSALEQYQQILMRPAPYLMGLPDGFAVQMLILVRARYEEAHDLQISHGVYEQALTEMENMPRQIPNLMQVPTPPLPNYAAPPQWFW